MTELIIGVGGNGTHSVLGYLHLCRLLNEPYPRPLKPLDQSETPGELIIFDADKKSNKPDSLCVRFKSIYSYPEENFWIDPNPSYIAKGSKFWAIFSNEPFLRHLFEENQLDIDIYEGYTGNPPVGATVMYNKIKEEIERPASGSLEDHFNIKCDERLNRVIFVGSFIGGTGAGAVPALARFIKNRSQNVEIVYLAHSDWFTLESRENNINTEILKRNVVGGMSFLIKEAELFKTRVLLDYKEEDMVMRPNDGPGEQGEKRDFMYLLAGFLIRGFMKTKSLSDGFYGICLNDIDSISSIFDRFFIKDTYSSQDEFFSLITEENDTRHNTTNNGNIPTLFGRIKKAYKVYFYLNYFYKWLSSPAFQYQENPLPDKTEEMIKQSSDVVKEVLKRATNELKESLTWLEDLKYPERFKSFIRLPYRLRDYPESGTLEDIYNYLTGKNILDPGKLAESLSIAKDNNVSESLKKKIWELILKMKEEA